MKTPYDALRRLRRRELDELRLGVAVAEASADAAAVQVAMLERKAVEEGALANGLPGFDFSRFVQRIKLETMQAREERNSALVKLEATRQRSLQAFVDKKAVDLATDTFVEDRTKAALRTDQARLDEIALRRYTR